MTPYFTSHDGSIVIYHGDCRDVLPTLTEPVGLVLTDPPYSPACHAGARTGDVTVALVDFASTDADSLRSTLSLCASTCEGWIVSFMDWRHIAALSDAPPSGFDFVRFGVWVKPNGAPQFTGDRPGPGWEGIAFLHRSGRRLAWNGGGRSSVFICNKENTEHPTGKPVRLVRQLIQLFSHPGDVVVDPFMGSGSTLRAAMDLGRRAIGIEIEERYCEIAARRLSQAVLPLEVVTIAASAAPE